MLVYELRRIVGASTNWQPMWALRERGGDYLLTRRGTPKTFATLQDIDAFLRTLPENIAADVSLAWVAEWGRETGFKAGS